MVLLMTMSHNVTVTVTVCWSVSQIDSWFNFNFQHFKIELTPAWLNDLGAQLVKEQSSWPANCLWLWKQLQQNHWRRLIWREQHFYWRVGWPWMTRCLLDCVLWHPKTIHHQPRMPLCQRVWLQPWKMFSVSLGRAALCWTSWWTGLLGPWRKSRSKCWAMGRRILDPVGQPSVHSLHLGKKVWVELMICEMISNKLPENVRNWSWPERLCWRCSPAHWLHSDFFHWLWIKWNVKTTFNMMWQT